MTGFVVVSLCIFAPFAPIGLAVPFLLAAKYRQGPLAVTALVIAAWVVVVLVSAAVMLP